jgi:hypothetical protein
MNSEQYSETPLPEKRCPQCGERMTDETCASCAVKNAIWEGLPRHHGRDDLPYLREPYPTDTAGWAVFGVLVIFVLAGLALSVPGVLLVLLIVATPAFVRALMATSRRSDEASVALPPSFIQVFFSSLGVAAVVGIAAMVTFFAACFVTGYGAVIFSNSIEGGVTCGIVTGAICGLVMAVWAFRKIWGKKP